MSRLATRLCIARVAVPKILLVDEPAWALAPIATMKIEELIKTLRIVRNNCDRYAQYATSGSF